MQLLFPPPNASPCLACTAQSLLALPAHTAVPTAATCPPPQQVCHLKHWLVRQAGAPARGMSLTHRGRALKGLDTLGESGVQREDTLTLNLRLHSVSARPHVVH
jgi:hypothetical protein